MKNFKLDIFFKILLYISSLIPLFIMIFLKNMPELSLKAFLETFCGNMKLWIIISIISAFSLLILSIWIISMKNEYRAENGKYKMGKIQSYDGEVMNYFITYLIPLLSLDIINDANILMNVLFLIIVGSYFISNNALHFNVTLLIIGYHIYTNDEEHIIISRKSKYDIINHNIKADQIGTSNIFYIE